MSTIKSSAEDLTLNADGSGNDVIIQSDGSTKAIVTAEGTVGIGTDSPTQKLDISGHVLFGNGRTDNSEKHSRLTAINYANSSVNPIGVIYANGQSGGNFIRYGGGTDSISPVSTHSFFTASGTPATGEGTNRLTIEDDGDVTVENGNLVIGTSGKGIDFSATSDIAGTSSEILDDYEEGTHTATLNMGSGTASLSTNTLTYTKIGRQVHVCGQVRIGTVSSPDGQLQISLPFTVATLSAGNYRAYNIDTPNDGESNVIYADSASAYATLEWTRDGATATPDRATENGYFLIGLTYFT